MTACSDKDVVTEEGTDVLKEKGVGYFKVNINLPDDAPATTRAWNENNTILKDGKDKEWGVSSALLVIFTGTDEASATVAQVNTLTGDWNSVTADNPNQVTKKHEEVVQLTAATNSKLYALAVINGTGVIEAQEGVLKVKNNGAWTEVSTIGSLQSAIAQANATTGANSFVAADSTIFMTNAVLSNVRGGKVDPSTEPAMHILAPLNTAYIYETEAAAQAGTPATDIYVERGVAKVTIDKTNLAVNGPLTTVDGDDEGTEPDAPTLTFVGWCLDRTNTQSYVVRNVPAYSEVAGSEFRWNYFNTKCAEANDLYRFVGNTPVDAEYSTATAGYRTYWAKDPNYTTTTVPLFSPTLDDALTDKVGETLPQYCYENTFDVDHQSYHNTTSVIIKVLLGNTDFYTVGADRKTLYNADDVETMIANVLMGLSDFKTWYDEQVGNHTTVLTKDDIAVTWSSTAAGVITVSNIAVTIPAAAAHPGTTNISTIDGGTTFLSTINSQVSNIKRYVGGATYYAIRIQHFGEELTPWNKGELSIAPTESEITTIYPTGDGADARNAAYLGRYGVVRNNWYELALNDIVKIGAATPEELRTKEHPDDDLEDSYIKARINILSWAKRPQSWNLK